MDDYVGRILKERYRLTEILGRGGMGCVFKATEIKSGELYAIKFLQEHVTSEREKQRFQRELQIISQLKNPHVVKSMDYGEYDGMLYIVMEFVQGRSLSEFLEETFGESETSSLDPLTVLQITLDVIVGLSEAHRLGVVHRDLKPDNIMVTVNPERGLRAKVIDFGVAKPFDDASGGVMIRDELTKTNMIIGTPKYMAPEQFMREEIDHRTDLYAVGILMYLMLSGSSPFQHGDPVPDEFKMLSPEYQVLWLHLNKQPDPLPVHPLLWDLISDLLQKKITQRPESTREVMGRLEELIQVISERDGPASDRHATADFEVTALMEEIPEMASLLSLSQEHAQDPMARQAVRRTQPLPRQDINTEEIQALQRERLVISPPQSATPTTPLVHNGASDIDLEMRRAAQPQTRTRSGLSVIVCIISLSLMGVGALCYLRADVRQTIERAVPQALKDILFTPSRGDVKDEGGIKAKGRGDERGTVNGEVLLIPK